MPNQLSHTGQGPSFLQPFKKHLPKIQYLPGSLLVVGDTGMVQSPFSRSSQPHPGDTQTVTINPICITAQMRARREVTEEAFHGSAGSLIARTGTAVLLLKLPRAVRWKHKQVHEFDSVQHIFHRQSYCPRHCTLNWECAGGKGAPWALNELPEYFSWQIQTSVKRCFNKWSEL